MLQHKLTLLEPLVLSVTVSLRLARTARLRPAGTAKLQLAGTVKLQLASALAVCEALSLLAICPDTPELLDVYLSASSPRDDALSELHNCPGG